MTDEHLIEKAKERIRVIDADFDFNNGENPHDLYDALIDRFARAALAVFEEAHAPTNDEREALAEVIEPFDFHGTEPVEALADAILAAGFRRSVVPEPSAPHCDGCARFAHHHCYHCGKRAGLPHAPFCPNFTDAEPEPQAEPDELDRERWHHGIDMEATS